MEILVLPIVIRREICLYLSGIDIYNLTLTSKILRKWFNEMIKEYPLVVYGLAKINNNIIHMAIYRFYKEVISYMYWSKGEIKTIGEYINYKKEGRWISEIYPYCKYNHKLRIRPRETLFYEAWYCNNKVHGLYITCQSSLLNEFVIKIIVDDKIYYIINICMICSCLLNMDKLQNNLIAIYNAGRLRDLKSLILDPCTTERIFYDNEISTITYTNLIHIQK